MWKKVKRILSCILALILLLSLIDGQQFFVRAESEVKVTQTEQASNKMEETETSSGKEEGSEANNKENGKQEEGTQKEELSTKATEKTTETKNEDGKVDKPDNLNKENETRLGFCGPSAMSRLTSGILSSVNYEQVQETRNKNLAALHRILSPYNEFPVFRSVPTMSYPFLWKEKQLKNALIQSKIYVPTLWTETLENLGSSSWERYLSEHLCILPIDQRYDTSDMEYIGNTVLNLINETSL